MARTLRELEIDHLGDTATEQDLADFKATVQRILPAFRGDEGQAIAYIWGNGDYYKRLDAGQTINNGSLLAEILLDLDSQGKYVIADGATDWDPDALFDESSVGDLLTEVYCQVDDTDADETGRVGYIVTYDDAGYIQSSQPLYTVYLASKREGAKENV